MMRTPASSANSIVLARHIWGVPQPWAPRLPAWRDAGYNAIEVPYWWLESEPDFTPAMVDAGFAVITQVITEVIASGTTPADHADALARGVERSQELDAVRIVVHSGKDWWPERDEHAYFERAIRLAETTGATICHETHRGRLLFHPAKAASAVERFPELGLCVDMSHWVCVCESDLADQQETIAKVLPHCRHAHARVGHPEGPQVPDPRDPRWADLLSKHTEWWRACFEAQRSAGDGTVSATPEYGPPDYLWTMPHSGEPVADLEAVCDWQAGRVRELMQSCVGIGD